MRTWQRQMQKSIGHVAFIGEYEYYVVADGRLMRAPIVASVAPDGRREGIFWASAKATKFALWIARVGAGQEESDAIDG